jgi:ABC-type uncharacterized transport system involved in gliding motility auxiliary subunit
MLGVTAIIFSVFGGVAYSFTGNALDPYVLAHFALGLILMSVYLLGRGKSIRHAIRLRRTRRGLHAAFYSLAFAGVIVMLNVLNARYGYRWDLTEEKVFSVSSQTIKALAQLKRDLEVYGFFEGGENDRVTDLMRSYSHHSQRIKFRAIDPERHPEMAREFKVQHMNTLHLRYGTDTTNITGPDEESLTNAIIKLAKTKKNVVYFLTGHGEPNPVDRESGQGYAAAREALENENYRIGELLLAAQEKVPEDASILIAAGPQKPFLPHEVDALNDYLKHGGRLLVLTPPPGSESLKAFLKPWGVKVGDDIVVDQVVRSFAGPSLGVEPIIDAFSRDHPITREFSERVIFPMTRTIAADDARAPGLAAVSLMQTSRSSWAERDVEAVFKRSRAALGPEDVKGPVSVGVAVTADVKKLGAKNDGEAKLVVLGSSGFASNRFLHIFFNRDFFLNVVNWLGGEEEMISIRPRSIRASRVYLTEREGSMIFYLSFLILPEILLITGLAVWWKRG